MVCFLLPHAIALVIYFAVERIKRPCMKLGFKGMPFFIQVPQDNYLNLVALFFYLFCYSSLKDVVSST